MAKTVLAHDGPHQGDCEIEIGQNRLSLKGYQAQDMLPRKHYCRIYPELGVLSFQLELSDNSIKPSQTKLKIVTMATWAELLANPFDVFNKLVIEHLGQVDKNGKITVETKITKRGFYRLEVILLRQDGAQDSNYFIFLVGVPTAKILIGFCGLLLLFLVVTAFRPNSVKPESRL